MAKIPTIKEVISAPDNVEFTLDGTTLTVKGEKGSLIRQFSHPLINVKLKDSTLEITCANPRKREKALEGTFAAHIRNMIKGVTEGFEYSMKTVYAHFPIKTAVEGNEFVIHNFLGERSARRAKILDGVTVEAKGDDVTVHGIDKEKVGQTVANIERATKVKRRDIRVFQDGVYLTGKRG